MAEEVDIVMKKHDSYEPLRVILKIKNPNTSEWEPLDLSTALQVTILIKPERGTGAAVERPCTAWGGGSIKSSSGPTAGQVEYAWHQNDLEPAITPERFLIEWEVETPETAGVKRFRTIPGGRPRKYVILEVVADLGVA